MGWVEVTLLWKEIGAELSGIGDRQWRKVTAKICFHGKINNIDTSLARQ